MTVSTRRKEGDESRDSLTREVWDSTGVGENESEVLELPLPPLWVTHAVVVIALLRDPGPNEKVMEEEEEIVKEEEPEVDIDSFELLEDPGDKDVEGVGCAESVHELSNVRAAILIGSMVFQLLVKVGPRARKEAGGDRRRRGSPPVLMRAPAPLWASRACTRASWHLSLLRARRPR